jgi:hypothetical protein
MATTITNNYGKTASYHSSVLDSADFDPRNYNLDYDTLQNYLKEGMLDKEKEMIDLVGKLIMERLDQLLDKDTDELVRILLENKLFQDENGKLMDRIHVLEEQVSILTARIQSLEWKDTTLREIKHEGEKFWTTLPYTTSESPNWGITTPGTNGSFTLTRTNGPVLMPDEKKTAEDEEKGIVSRIIDSLGLKKDTGSDQSKAL